MTLESQPALSPIYVYDGECVLCSRAVRYCLKYDQAEPPLQYVAIKSKLGRQIAARNNVNPDDPFTFIYVAEGQDYILSDAAFAIVKYVGGPWNVLRIFHSLPRPVRDWLYLRIALNRYKVFGKLKTCFIPDTAYKQQFVLE